MRWKVGDPITFAGHATDAQEGTLPGTSLTWSLVMRHCVTPTSCHSHQIEDYAGVGGGSFNAPDHEYPSYLELTVTATDAAGLTDTETMQLDPQTVRLTLASQPAGAEMTFNSETATAPLMHEVIARSRNSIGVTTPQAIAGQDHVFESWSDGGAAGHDVTAPDSDGTLTANLTPVSTAVFSPEADARVQEANPSSNYGLGYLRTNGVSNPPAVRYRGAGEQCQAAPLRDEQRDRRRTGGVWRFELVDGDRGQLVEPAGAHQWAPRRQGADRHRDVRRVGRDAARDRRRNGFHRARADVRRRGRLRVS
jgi:hypothetical protein